MIYIMNRQEKVVAILTNNGSPNSCPYYEDVLKESLDTGTSSYEFKVPTNHEVADLIQEGCCVARKDLDGNLLMFTIMRIEESHAMTGEKFIYSENAGLELLNDFVRPNILSSKSAEFMVDFALTGTRWEVGQVDYFGVDNFTVEYKNVVGFLLDLAKTFGGELRFRVEMLHGEVSHRYVDLLEQRGTYTGKRFSYGKDIQSIRRTVDMSNLATALIGIGQDNLDFRGVSASDKPMNQDWIGDDDALERYGTQGKHLFGTFSFDTNEPNTLLNKTREELQNRKNPQITYEMDVSLLERLANLDPESTRLGDTVHAVDDTFSPPLYLEARVRELETSFSDPTKDRCLLGNFKLLTSNITAQMRDLQTKLLKKEATWDTVKDALQLAQDVDTKTKPLQEEAYDKGFNQGKSLWSEVLEGQNVPEATTGVVTPSPDATDFGVNVMTLQGQSTLVSRNAIVVNTNRVYKISFRVRQSIDPTTMGNAGVFAGVGCLNESFTDLTGGLHRFCAVSNVQTTVADGWQIFTGFITGEGAGAEQFAVGTKFVRPVFIVNYANGDGTAEVDYINFEDVTETKELNDTVDQVKLLVAPDAIISTVTQSVSYQETISNLVPKEQLTSLATKDDLTNSEDALNVAVDAKIANLKLATTYATKTEVEQTAGALDFKFSSSGGVNLLKNSVGFAEDSFWTRTMDASGTWDSIQNAELDEKGVGSGFLLNGAKLVQTVTSASDFFTIAVLVKKGTTGTGYIKVTYDNGIVVQRDLLSGTAYDYEKKEIIIEPSGNTFTVELYGSVGANVTFTALMANVGNVSLQWQHSAGELYNTNVLMDVNGMKVLSSAYNGYTVITPQEFSGYADVNGAMTRVFTLNKDVTEMTKIQVDSEIAMAPLKIVPVDTALNRGWAFVGD